MSICSSIMFVCKIRCNPMHPLRVPYVPALVTRCTLFACRMCQLWWQDAPSSRAICASSGDKKCFWLTNALLRCRTSRYRWTSIPLLSGSVDRSRWPCTYSMIWDCLDLRAGPMFFIGPSCSFSFWLLLFFLLSSFFLWVGIVGLGSSAWQAVTRSLPSLHCRPFKIIIIHESTISTGYYFHCLNRRANLGKL